MLEISTLVFLHLHDSDLWCRISYYVSIKSYDLESILKLIKKESLCHVF